MATWSNSVSTSSHHTTRRCGRVYPRLMTGLTPYLHFAGSAREALLFYQGVFGGDVELNTFADFGRTDGPISPSR